MLEFWNPILGHGGDGCGAGMFGTHRMHVFEFIYFPNCVFVSIALEGGDFLGVSPPMLLLPHFL